MMATMTSERMLLDERRVFRGQAIGQLHQHFRGPEFGAVQSAGERVDGLGFRDEVMGFRVGEAARVGQAREVVAILVEMGDGVFRADEDDDGVAAFFGLADAQHFDAAGVCAARVS